MMSERSGGLERGPKGDHGQPGADGRDGRKGESGQKGEPGEKVLTRVQILVGFVFVTFSYRSEVNANNISQSAQKRDDQIHAAAVTACANSNRNSEALNSILDELIANVRTATFLTPEEIAQRIAGYESRKVELLDCR
jgi:hypothetical protein